MPYRAELEFGVSFGPHELLVYSSSVGGPAEMRPTERNARVLVSIMAEFFGSGTNSESLREKYQAIANRKAATYYFALAWAKRATWIVNDGRSSLLLNANGCWRSSGIDAQLERHQLEHTLSMRTQQVEKLKATNKRLRDAGKAIAAGEGASTAIATLVTIMGDPAVATHARLQAASNLLEYKTPPDIAERAKTFLSEIFTDPTQSISHRLAATTALRRSEDPRMLPPPPARTDNVVDLAESPIPLSELLAQRMEYHDRMGAELERQMAEERAAFASPKRSNGDDQS